MNVHILDGCAPTPLAHYLKALGVLRLIAEQADHAARGWWQGEKFLLATVLSRDELLDFFVVSYAPTPFVAPWNKGSGFYQPDDPGLVPLERSQARRFEAIRVGIAAARRAMSDLGAADAAVRAIKQRSKSGDLSKTEREALRKSENYRKELAEADRRFAQLKAELIPRLRSYWRGPHRDWMDTALVIDDSGTARFPALMGTGGNDGRLDFTNNFMQRLGELFDLSDEQGRARAQTSLWIEAALWGGPVMGCLQDRAVGQFLPGGAGGANSTNGALGTSQLNPFDFVLMLEGCLPLAASTTKRLDAQSGSRAAAPFVATSHAAGYASSSESDETARGEQWMPLWSQPATYAECRRLFAEGRVQIAATTARQPLDMARALVRMGVSRGVAAFQRYGYVERNGQSNLAVPLGRFRTRQAGAPQASCLDDIATWAARVKRQTTENGASSHLQAVGRKLASNFLDAAQSPERPEVWQALLLGMASVESVMKTGAGFKAQPAPALRPEWVEAADDGSAEFRLALSFALQAREFRRDTLAPVDDIRRHWLPMDAKSSQPRFATTGDVPHLRLDKRPDVVIQGRRGIDDAVALVERRLVEDAASGRGAFGLRAAPRAAAHPADLSAWLQGGVDADRTLALARGLMALDRVAWAEQIVRRSRPSTPGDWPDDAWLCIRLAHLPWALPDGRQIRSDPAIVRRLAVGDAATAVQLALRRLQSAGLRPALRAATASADTARAWAAALAFPITQATAERMAARLHVQTAQENPA